MDTLTALAIPLAALVVGVVTAYAALAGLRWVRCSGRSSARMAVNDADRRYAELTPALNLEWRAQYGRRAVLVVTMAGPVGLERLDRVEVTVADPIPDRAPVIAGGPTQQELDAQVWGPYRFVTSTAHVASHRTAQLDQVQVNIPVHLAMERAPAPHWVADFAGWEEERAGDPVLITLVCHHADHQSWTLHRSVPVRSG